MHKDSRNTAATKWTKCFVYTRWNTFAGKVDGSVGRGAGAWGAQFHGPFGLAALGVNNNHKDVTITHWNRSEWTAMCDVNVWRVPTEKSVEQLSNWCLDCVYFMVSSPHNARHLYDGEMKMEMGFHHGSSSRSQYLRSSWGKEAH